MQIFLGIILFALWLFLTIKLRKIYHSMFNVDYFGFSAVIKEVAMCGSISFAIVALIINVLGNALGLA